MSAAAELVVSTSSNGDVGGTSVVVVELVKHVYSCTTPSNEYLSMSIICRGQCCSIATVVSAEVCVGQKYY